MKILVDENMPYAKVLFKRLGYVKSMAGRLITQSSLHTADALMIRSTTCVDKTLINGSQIKFIGTATSGTDHVDKDFLVQEGIKFSSAPGCNAIAVVEYIFSALLWLAQRDSFHLYNKTVGIIGVGNVGRCLQQRLSVLGIRTLLCDPPLAESGVNGDWYPLETLITEADVITLHTPLTVTGRHATWHLINDDLLSSIPSGCIIINTSRGAVIDNVALLNALKHGKSVSVVIDVWESEPELLLPLLGLVDIGTAHIAGYTLEGKARGTIKLFNDYSAYIGNNESVIIGDLLPLPSIDYVRVRGSINENTLRLLVFLLYDIRIDDMKLRSMYNLQNEFDNLRNNYYQRREWSSLFVETDDIIGADILCQLGFNAYCVE